MHPAAREPADEKAVDSTSHLDPAGPAVTWLGHATAIADLGRARFLFDPLMRSRTRAAGKVDAVLVTHSHVDHLNRWSLKAVDRDTHLLVPKGAKDVVEDLGFRQVTEMDVGDQLEVSGAQITAVGTKHDHGRWRKSSSPVALGYVVSGGGACVHHAGDVDFSDHAVFDEIGKHHRIDAALLPIGGMMPVWYYRWRRTVLDRGVHIDPDCALDIYERLGARTLVPVHWGTVNLRFGLPSMPRRRLAKIAAARAVGGVEILAHRQRLFLTSSDHAVKP